MSGLETNMRHPAFARQLTISGAFVALHAFVLLGPAVCIWQQDSASLSSQAQTPAAPKDAAPASQTETKKPKKVWTNDDLGNANAATSGDSGNDRTTNHAAEKSASSQYVANARKQLD